MSTRLDRVEALFHVALEKPAHERAVFLASIEPDPSLREDALRLLARDERAETDLRGALDAALIAAAATPRRERIGAYRLIRELGSGGMGTVFLAERDIGETRQRVALKLVRGFPTADARARLARERSLLAGLDHPNIARLLDGGDSEDGQPYLVMDYIEGAPLLDHCTHRALGLAARLRLFVRLCRAVQHAHQRLIVHRDLKPGNVLVRADDEPVLLDFGIAKLLDAAPVDRVATRVFTPAYAAPEQRRGEAATTASDVYGLGCILFELVGGGSVAELRGDEALPKPSANALARVLARGPHGELDQIVATAAHESPDRRYASADALAADVERHLAGRPIAALPDRLSYRTRKYIERHRYGTAAALLAILLLAASVWRLAVERAHALEQARRAETARDFLLSVFNAAAPENGPAAQFSARELVEFGRRRVEEFPPQPPLLRAQILAMLGRLYVSFGDPQAATALLEPALALAGDDDDETQRVRADIEDALGRAYHDLDRVEDSTRAYRLALALREEDGEEIPLPLARTLQQLGRSEYERGRTASAVALLQRALTLREAAQPSDMLAIAETRRTLALAHLDLGDVAVARAEAQAVEALVRRHLPAQHPGLIDALDAHAIILNRQGAFEDARAKLEEALAIARASIGEASTITANLENLLAESLLGLGRFRDSLVHSEAAYAIQKRVRANDPAAGAIARADLGVAHATIGDYVHAKALLLDAVDALANVRPEDDPERLRARSNLARVQSLAGEHATALAAFADIVERTRVSRGERSERYAFELMRLATAEVRAGDFDSAQARIDHVEPMFAAVFPADHPWRADLHIQRGRIALGRDDAAAAEREFAVASNLLAARAGLGYDMRLIASIGHVEALAQLGRDDTARAELGLLKTVVTAELLPTSVERRRLEAIDTRLRVTR